VLRRLGNRDRLVLATKVHGRMADDDPNAQGNGRRHLIVFSCNNHLLSSLIIAKLARRRFACEYAIPPRKKTPPIVHNAVNPEPCTTKLLNDDARGHPMSSAILGYARRPLQPK